MGVLGEKGAQGKTGVQGKPGVQGEVGCGINPTAAVHRRLACGFWGLNGNAFVYSVIKELERYALSTGCATANQRSMKDAD